jgi:hypothetical protein
MDSSQETAGGLSSEPPVTVVSILRKLDGTKTRTTDWSPNAGWNGKWYESSTRSGTPGPDITPAEKGRDNATPVT